VFQGTPLEAQVWKLLVNPTTFVCHLKYKDDEKLIECTDKRHRLGGSSNLHTLINKVIIGWALTLVFPCPLASPLL
tara:strand:+ start:413 stop:640 length:228 start_codon:yes stop_codon:yes gene_type:complete